MADIGTGKTLHPGVVLAGRVAPKHLAQPSSSTARVEQGEHSSCSIH
jgi:hypothetical protein